MPYPVRLLLILLSAALAIASFPPFHWSGLALIAWIPLIVSLRGESTRKAALLGLIHGMLLFVGTLNWFVEIFGPLALLLHFLLTLFTIAFAILFSTFEQTKMSPWVRAPLAAVLWTGIEHFRCEWFNLRFPWITPGTALPPNALTPAIGVYGVSLLVILGAVWISTPARPQRIAGLVTLLTVIAATFLTGDIEGNESRTIRVAAVQGETLSIDQYLELSSTVDTPIDAFVWPEYALSYDIRKNPKGLARIREMLGEHQAELLVVGSMTNLPERKWSNTAVIIGRDSILGSHNKNRPVHFFNDGEPGCEAPAWPTPHGKVATPICFDNDYAAVVRQAVTNGAEFLLVPSMDAAHWTARQHLQHGELVRHRAAENGRWIVVASSSGLTQVIDPSGKRRDSLPLFDPGVLVADISTQSELTIFTRIGWLLGPVTTVAVGLLIIAVVIKSRIERKHMTRPTPA